MVSGYVNLPDEICAVIEDAVLSAEYSATITISVAEFKKFKKFFSSNKILVADFNVFDVGVATCPFSVTHLIDGYLGDIKYEIYTASSSHSYYDPLGEEYDVYKVYVNLMASVIDDEYYLAGLIVDVSSYVDMRGEHEE